MDRQLYCFQFFIESIENSDFPNCARIDFKFRDYEWQSMVEDEWTCVGRRCYLLNDEDFLYNRKNNKVTIHAICKDGSLHSCELILSTLQNEQSEIVCKGALKLYSSVDTSPSLQLNVDLRLCKIDRDHPISAHRPSMAYDQQVQATVENVNCTTQIWILKRNVGTQTKLQNSRNVGIQMRPMSTKMVDVAVQCKLTKLNIKKFKRIIAKVILKLLINFPAKRSTVRPAPSRGATNIQSGMKSIRDTQKFCQRYTSVEVAPFSQAQSIHPTNIGFNLVCRQQLIRSLDRIIESKKRQLMLTQKQIRQGCMESGRKTQESKKCSVENQRIEAEMRAMSRATTENSTPDSYSGRTKTSTSSTSKRFSDKSSNENSRPSKDISSSSQTISYDSSTSISGKSSIAMYPNEGDNMKRICT